MMGSTGFKNPLGSLVPAKPGPSGSGSSLASLCAALAAALAGMVGQCALAQDYPGRLLDQLEGIPEAAAKLQAELLDLAAQDAAAGQALQAALKLPSGEIEAWEARRQRVEAAAKLGTKVPLETARICVEILHLSETVVSRGRRETVTDGAAAGLLARAALRIASYKVRACLDYIVGDRSFVTEVSTDLNRYEHHGAVLESSIIRAADKVLLNN